MSSTLSAHITTTSVNVSTLEPYSESPEEQQRNFWIGLGLAVGSSFFIGSSFIFQKLGLLSVAKEEGGVRAMALGEGCNFVAFAFAPATLITPLGALSVIFSAVLASYFLDEGLNLLGKIGCILCILGSTVVVIHSPRYAEVQNMDDLLAKIKEPAILSVIGLFIIAAALAIIFLAPKYGSSNVVVYVFICSTLGALTVTGCKGVGVALKETFAGRNEFTNWLTYVMLGTAAINILFQINFLNKALDTFNTAVVTPTYYVMFTSCVAIVSLVLYQEFAQLTIKDIIGDVCGFLTIVCGIFMLNAFKDLNVTLKNIPSPKKTRSVSITVNDEVRMSAVTRDTNYVLNCNENDSESESESPHEAAEPFILEKEGYNNSSFIDRPVNIPGELAKSNELHKNGYVNQMSLTERKQLSDNEVTHF